MRYVGTGMLVLLMAMPGWSEDAHSVGADVAPWGPLSGVEEIVFAVRKPGKDGHWYANFSYYAEGPQRVTYEDGGKLLKYNLRYGHTAVLLEDAQGGVRDPQVHYDGQRIVFSYRKGGTCNYHLYEIGVDGTGLRQLTDGPYDDV
ncbi:MAG: hypothetical protein HYZ00_13725, partial [Candidatus Hydrogenedentes bacterium]|nr:hypothetical protein [Candidatus Hydrogenedentota bacterium]